MTLKTGFLMLMILCMLPLAGCWNYREMNELAIALAMGVDKLGQDEYLFSFQVVNARDISGIKATGRIPVNVFSGTGKTLLEAIRKASQKVPRRINAQHMRVFVIGEALAREGIEEVFDFNGTRSRATFDDESFYRQKFRRGNNPEDRHGS